jgi:hypothetical protein
MDSGKPITTVLVSSLQIIAAGTKVKIFPRPISSATSAPGISASQTHLCKMGIQQPDRLIKTLVSKCIVDCIENIAYY